MKKCNHCKQDKPLSEFNKNKNRKDGLQGNCKICQAAYTKRHYERNKQPYKDRTKANKIRLRAWLKEYKETICCEKCGEGRPPTLDFHHLDPTEKDHNISHMITKGGSEDKILEEIQKCIVVCANCHRMIHSESV
jgi:hypothetical protein